MTIAGYATDRYRLPELQRAAEDEYRRDMIPMIEADPLWLDHWNTLVGGQVEAVEAQRERRGPDRHGAGAQRAVEHRCWGCGERLAAELADSHFHIGCG